VRQRVSSASCAPETELCPAASTTLQWVVAKTPGLALATFGPAFGIALGKTQPSTICLGRPQTGGYSHSIRQAQVDRGCVWVLSWEGSLDALRAVPGAMPVEHLEAKCGGCRGGE
jgi:hypothetical protein